MTIFDFDDYKKWTNKHIETMPKGGRGQYRRLSEQLGTNSAIITQVFKGDRELTPEQALLLADYFGLSKNERQFLILLVNYSRATSRRYQELLKEEIEIYRERATKIKNRVAQNRELSEIAKATIYSNWYYLAIWSLTAIEGFDNIEAISERLEFSKKKTREAVDFLVKHSMILNLDGKLKVGPTLLHLEADSPMIARHHQNWRLQGFKHHEDAKAGDLFYSAPVTLSQKDALKLREKIISFIAESVNLIKDSPSEKLYTLGIDWFEV